MATVETISIRSHFLFHMGAAQICSALSHIRHTWEWKEKTTVATFEIIWAKLYKSIRLAKERPQKGRVTVGLSTDQIQCQNHQSGLRLRVVPHFSSVIVEWAKRERAWKSPHARKGDTQWGERKMRLNKGFGLFNFSGDCLLDLNNFKRFFFGRECDGFLQCFVTLGPAR